MAVLTPSGTAKQQKSGLGHLPDQAISAWF
jgi:hypothetical protein